MDLVTPQTFIVDKATGEADVRVRELVPIIMRIEATFGFPVDVEWAYADGTFYILQARPITTL